LTYFFLLFTIFDIQVETLSGRRLIKP